MPDTIRPYISRVLAPVIVYLIGLLASKLGIIVTEDQVQAMAELLVAIILVGITHKAIDSRVNPVDAARISTAKAHSDQPGQ